MARQKLEGAVYDAAVLRVMIMKQQEVRSE
jgi:hypothetical protein